jgi:hypothetical protein
MLPNTSNLERSFRGISALVTILVMLAGFRVIHGLVPSSMKASPNWDLSDPMPQV